MAEPPTNASGIPGLLRLTSDTRRLIYQHAGVASRDYFGTPALVVYKLGDPSGFLSARTQYEIEEGFQTFHGLLLCCRTIYVEVSALLYSANWFIVHYQRQRTLASLRALTPHALAHLTHLKIVLNQTTCHQARVGCEAQADCWGADHKFKSNPCCLPHWHIEKHDFPLDASSALSKALFAEWYATAAYLALYIVPSQLELSLVCDVQHDDPQAAQLVLDGLRLLPPLKDCHVRLCGTREPVLQRLAQAAVLQARAITSSSEPAVVASPGSLRRPRLVNLPRELRLRILEYTDLVTPWKEVIWSRTSGGYRIERPRCEVLISGGECLPEFHHGCQFNQCWETPSPEPSVGCFCRRTHTAFSSRCRCWRPPTPLFLICRALYPDANQVLYNENRFIVIDDRDFPISPTPPGDYPHKSFAASQFLRHVVPLHCLGHLRFLELVFTPINHLNRPSDGHPALQDWSETLDWVRDKLNPLTLRLVVASNDPPTTESKEMTRAQGKEVLAVYNSILHPLRSLAAASDGAALARFYARLAWPLKWSREVVWSRELVDSKERELKRRAEQHIMGDQYVRACVSAREPHDSVWTWSSHQLY